MSEEYASIGKHFGSIAKRTKECCKCGQKGRYGMWGNYYCKDCFKKYLGKDPDEIAEEKGGGHSGMLPFKTTEELKTALSQTYLMPQSFKYPCLIQVPKGDKLFASLYLTHYPQSKGIVGRTINYLVIWKQRVIGIIGGNSAPYSVKAVDKFFGITNENRADMLLCLLNNEVFRLIESDKNLASMTLKSFRRTMKIDYEKKYGCPLIGLITFVEPPREGSIYRADNWIYLGMTAGYGTTRRGKRWFDRKWIKKEPKHIYAYIYPERKVYKLPAE